MDVRRVSGWNGGSMNRRLGGGIAPVSYSFSPAVGQVLTFPNVSGTINVSFGGDASPEGLPLVIGGLNYTNYDGPWNGISKFYSLRYACLVGVFLTDAEPSNPPPAFLDFIAIGTRFKNLAPQIAQIFFIGNSRTLSGRVQQFVVPTNATRLYLGIPDSPGSHGTGTNGVGG